MNIVEQLAAAALVLAALIGSLRLLRSRPRISARRQNRETRLECVDRLALTHQHSLHLVRAGTQILVIGVGPGTISLVHEVPPNAGVRSEPPQ